MRRENVMRGGSRRRKEVNVVLGVIGEWEEVRYREDGDLWICMCDLLIFV